MKVVDAEISKEVESRTGMFSALTKRELSSEEVCKEEIKLQSIPMKRLNEIVSAHLRKFGDPHGLKGVPVLQEGDVEAQQ